MGSRERSNKGTSHVPTHRQPVRRHGTPPATESQHLQPRGADGYAFTSPDNASTATLDQRPKTSPWSASVHSTINVDSKPDMIYRWSLRASTDAGGCCTTTGR